MGGAYRRLVLAAIVLLAAGPTFAYAVRGGGYISDDFGLLYLVRRKGALGAFADLATHGTGRPVAALGFSVLHGVTDGHPLPALLVLGLLNAGVALLVLRVAEALLPFRVAWMTALAWAALGNRGSTRLWLANLPGLLGLLLLLLGVLCLVGARRRLVLAGLAFSLSILAYEASILLVLAAIVVGALASTGGERRRVLCLAVPVIAALGYVTAMTPKLVGAAPRPFHGVSGLLAAQVGIGTFGTPGLTTVGLGLVVLRLAIALGRLALPGFTASPSDWWALAAVLIIALGAGPFAVAGFPFATDGLFDRGNSLAGLGTALLLATLVELGFEESHARATASWGVALTAVVALGWLSAQNLTDLADFRHAVDQGQALRAQVEQDLPTIPPGGVLVGPPLSSRGGVASFVLTSDLAAALAVQGHQPQAPEVVSFADGSKEDGGGFAETWLYDWRTRQLSARVPDAKVRPT